MDKLLINELANAENLTLSEDEKNLLSDRLSEWLADIIEAFGEGML